MTQLTNNPFYKTAVVIWLTLSVASVILAAVTWIQLSEKIEDARQAVAIQLSAERILRFVVDCETGQRGYSLTGREEFLEPFQKGEKKLQAELDSLVQLTRGDTNMLRKVMDLQSQADIAMDRLHTIVDMRRTNGMEAAAAIVADGKGRAMMDNIRLLSEGIGEARYDVISDNGQTARSQLMRASLTSLVAGVIGIGAGVFAFWLTRMMMTHQAREKGLIEAKLKAERNSQEKSVFLANMSHEIRTPMNSILGFSELLGTEMIEPRHRHYIKSIRASAVSLLQLINDILDMSKIEAGVMELRLEPTDPHEICDFLKTIFSEPAARKGVKLACMVEDDIPRSLMMDRIRLRQALVNLVGNAVKFTDQGNIYVRIKCERPESNSHVTLLIEVQDTGVGIPEDKLESIFSPFVQAGLHREKEKTGTGLGLSIVRRLTEMMGGTVTAVSVKGQGSAFSLRLPNVTISARLPSAARLESGAPANFNELRPSTLLVIDDNESNCQLIAGMFTGSHHRLVFGGNGREAVDKARSLLPEIILLDIRMPGMDGNEALGEIRKLPGLELTPVIAVTASSLMNEETDLKTRFSGYLRKPFSKREMFDELAQFLPAHTRSDGADDEANFTPDTGIVNAPPELTAELRRLWAEEWPGIRDSLAINETRAFAAKLQKLCQKWPCPPLERYAKDLAQHAENYSVFEMEKHLLQYAALVGRFDGKISA